MTTPTAVMAPPAILVPTGLPGPGTITRTDELFEAIHLLLNENVDHSPVTLQEIASELGVALETIKGRIRPFREFCNRHHVFPISGDCRIVRSADGAICTKFGWYLARTMDEMNGWQRWMIQNATTRIGTVGLGNQVMVPTIKGAGKTAKIKAVEEENDILAEVNSALTSQFAGKTVTVRTFYI